MNYKILLVDDHPVLLNGLYHDLKELDSSLEIVRKSTPDEALTFLENYPVDILVTDYSLQNEVNGIQLCLKAKKLQPGIKTILYTMIDAAQTIRDALAADVDGYILKKYDTSRIYRAIVTAENMYSPEITKILAGSADPVADEDLLMVRSLTHQEKEVMKLIAQQYNVKEIAGKLGLEKSTVYSHRAKLFEKLDTDSNVGIAHYAYKYKIVEIKD